MRKFLKPLDIADLARPLLNISVKLSYLLTSRSFKTLRLLNGVSGI
jgi:hypothetical protein